MMHPAQMPAEQLLAECTVQRTRRSGPGGQHRNKVETAVVLVHQPSGIQAEASERRSQAQNHAQALFRLRTKLALHVRLPQSGAGSGAGTPRLATGENENVRQPSSLLWQARCKAGRIVVSPKHDDFPAILAEALDCIDSQGYDVTTAARQLGATTSQLVKLLKSEPKALTLVNQQRKTRSLPPLK